MINFADTIAAISTAPGTGAIAIVRLSGPQSFSIVQQIFRRHYHYYEKQPSDRKDNGETNVSSSVVQTVPANSAELPAEPLKSIKPSPGAIQASVPASASDLASAPTIDATPALLKTHHATHGFIFDPASEAVVDEVMLVPFKGPNTYTGEDLVEISCHGGPVITAEVLALVLKHGARLARRGEFTERAFLSGKIDLTQAEAVLDIIQAKTSRQGRSALSALTGALGERIRAVRIDLMELLTRIVAGLDFPEEIGDAPEPEIESTVAKALSILQSLAKTARTGRYLREGIKIAIIGRPNSGKSSLLNQLLQFERAIVTDTPGTTRDSLEELLDINGIPVVLVDTAGIRPTDDHVEKIGIERSKKAIAECDLVFFLFDLTQGWSQAEEEILDILQDRSYILIGNKIDLVSGSVPDLASGSGSALDLASISISTSALTDIINRVSSSVYCLGKVLISARTGQGMSELTQAVESFVFKDESLRHGPSLNVRQTELCLKATSALELVQSTLAAQMPQDCLATDLKTAVDALSEISGESVSEEVITQVFATFCIGK